MIREGVRFVFSTLGLGKLLSKWFLTGCSHYNDLQTRRYCRSKDQAKQAFAELKVPSAKSCLFYFPHSAFNFARQYGFPVVVKPNIGGFSRGAYFPIENYWQLLKASILVKIWWPRSIIEQYLSGNNYRIVTIKNNIMSIARRYPPFVIGNGYDNIATLIKKENTIRIQMKLLPIMSCIPKNYHIWKHLKKQGLNFSNVIAKNKKINLHHKISLKLGSIIEVIDPSELTPNNRTMLFDILKYFRANILGIDVICQQKLSTDFTQQKCIFLEVNSCPFLAMHDVPRYGKKQDLSPYYAQLEQYHVTQKNIF